MVPQPAGRAPPALRRRGRRALRRLQRLALAQPDPARRCATSSAAQRRRSDAVPAAADAIRIGDPAIEIRLRRNAARAAHGAARRAGRPRPDADPAARRAARPGARLPDRPRGLAAAAPRGARRAARPVRDGTRAALRRRARSPLRAAAGRRSRCAGRRPARARAPGAASRRGSPPGCARRRGGPASAAAARHAARARAPAGRISLRDPRSRWGSCTAAGDLMFSWRLVAGAGRGARLRGGARGGASGRDEPLAALLGGGAAALPRLRRRRAPGCAATAPALHGYDFRPRGLTRLPAARMTSAMIERERLSETLAAGARAALPHPARPGHARAGRAGRGADAARHRRRVRGQHDARRARRCGGWWPRGR